MTTLNHYRVRLETLPISVTKDVEVGTTNKVATHTYPFSNKKTIEHMGTDTDILTLEFNLHNETTKNNPNVLKGWVRFLFLLASKGNPVTLVHPLLGEQKIQILSLKQKASPYEGRTMYPDFTMEFEIVDADVFTNKSARDELDFKTQLAKAGIISALADSSFEQAFKRYAKKGEALKSLIAKIGLTAEYDFVTKKFKLLKEGLTLPLTELDALDKKLAPLLMMLNNGALGVLGARARTLAVALRVQNRMANVLNIWNNTVSATRSFLDFGKMSNLMGYMLFVNAFDNNTTVIPPLKRTEVVIISDAVTSSINSYKNTLDKEVLSTRDFVLTSLESEADELFLAEDGAFLLAEESVTRSQALSKLSIIKPEAKSILETNDLLAFSVYLTMLMFMTDSVLNADLEVSNNAVSLESVDKITEVFEAVGAYFSDKIGEDLHSNFTELKNAFQSYKEEIAPFIYEINTVNTIQDILPNLLYSTNGNLDLLEDTLALNDTLFLDDIEGSVLVYKENV